MTKKIIIIGLVISTLSIVSCNEKLTYSSVKTESDCSEKEGYWFNDKCWKDYEDVGISNDKINTYVIQQMNIINYSKVMINDIAYPIIGIAPEQEDGLLHLIVIYQDGEKEKSIVSSFSENAIEKDSGKAKTTLYDKNIMALNEEESADIESMSFAKGDIDITVNNAEDLDLSFAGKLVSIKNNENLKIKFVANEALIGAGFSTIKINGNEALLDGELGTRAYSQVKDLIDNYPEVKTIVLGKINGSLNDAVNMHTGRILREANLNTKVLSNSSIASGGVDLFCAGKKRIMEKGAKVGIHSWCCVGDLTAIEVPKDHPAHQYQLDYFTMCLGTELGPEFYFHTLHSAPFNDIHWMTDDEIKQWKIATDFQE